MSGGLFFASDRKRGEKTESFSFSLNHFRTEKGRRVKFPGLVSLVSKKSGLGTSRLDKKQGGGSHFFSFKR